MSDHWLVVGPYDEDEQDHFEVDHPDCPNVPLYSDDEDPELVVTTEGCLIGWALEYGDGLSSFFQHADDPDKDDEGCERVGVGRHRIEYWEQRYGGWWEGYEYDSGIRLAECES